MADIVLTGDTSGAITVAAPAVAERFYVYTYSYPDGTPFYVGKGTKRRDKRHLEQAKYAKKVKSWCAKIVKGLLSKNELPIITRIIDNIDEELALLIESEYIDKYGRRDMDTGILVNATDGGEAGMTYNTETRDAIINNLVEVGKNTRFKKGQTAWNKGSQLSQEEYDKLHTKGFGFSKGNIPWNKGKKLSDQQKAKIFDIGSYTRGKPAWNKGLKMKRKSEHGES